MQKARRMYEAAMTAALAVLAPDVDITPASLDTDEGWEAAVALVAAAHLSVHLTNHTTPPLHEELEQELYVMLERMDRED